MQWYIVIKEPSRLNQDTLVPERFNFLETRVVANLNSFAALLPNTSIIIRIKRLCTAITEY